MKSKFRHLPRNDIIKLPAKPKASIFLRRSKIVIANSWPAATSRFLGWHVRKLGEIIRGSVTTELIRSKLPLPFRMPRHIAANKLSQWLRGRTRRGKFQAPAKRIDEKITAFKLPPFFANLSTCIVKSFKLQISSFSTYRRHFLSDEIEIKLCGLKVSKIRRCRRKVSFS